MSSLKQAAAFAENRLLFLYTDFEPTCFFGIFWIAYNVISSLLSNKRTRELSYSFVRNLHE
jgi:hypothetical protein